MKLNWTEREQALHDRLRVLGAGELGRDVTARETTQTLQPGDWKRCAEAGVLGLPLPAEYGGSGLPPLTCAYAMEGLGTGCRDNGLLFAVGAHMWAVELPILEYGTEEQKRHYLPALCDGRVVAAHAITEETAGSDALAVTTVARRDGDDYVLNGTKRFITNAPIADVFLVHATVDPALGFTGVTVFLVDLRQEGVTVETRFDKTGMRTAPWGELILRDCRVPVNRRLGAEKQGGRILARTMAWERSLILSPLLGTMQRQIDECAHYARTRHQFGRRIGEFGPVAHRIVDMRVRLETARMLTYRAAWELEQGTASSILPEAAQLHVSEAAIQTFLDAMQVYGGLGYTGEIDAERNARDALGTRISSGTSDMQRVVMAEKLGLVSRAGGRRRDAHPR